MHFLRLCFITEDRASPRASGLRSRTRFQDSLMLGHKFLGPRLRSRDGVLLPNALAPGSRSRATADANGARLDRGKTYRCLAVPLLQTPRRPATDCERGSAPLRVEPRLFPDAARSGKPFFVSGVYTSLTRCNVCPRVWSTFIRHFHSLTFIV